MTDLFAARAQMGISLGFHIVLAVLGMAMPLLMLIAEGIWLRTGNPVHLALARRWSKGFASFAALLRPWTKLQKTPFLGSDGSIVAQRSTISSTRRRRRFTPTSRQFV